MTHYQPVLPITRQFFAHRFFAHWRHIILGVLIGIAITLLLPTIGWAQSTCTNPYVVQRGDNLTRIARRCGVDYRALLRANPQITNPSRIEIGDRITIPGAAVEPTPVPLDLDQALANATYTATASDTGTITLRDGSAQRQTAIGELRVALVGPTAQGDINGDGVTDAATILLAQTANTSGRFYSLHVLLAGTGAGQGTVVEAGVAYLGDRIGVNSVQIQADGDLLLAMTTEGPNDPMAGASLNVVQTYRLRGNYLIAMAAKPVDSSGTGVVCPNTYPTRLQSGDRAYVLPEPALANTVRNAPSRRASGVGSIPPWGGMTILDGPECADSWVWWYVQADNGVTGWVGEGDWNDYWLQPGDLPEGLLLAPGPPPPPAPAAQPT